VNLALAIVLLVAAQRLAELLHGQRNARRLLSEGAIEAGASHYPILVLVHAGWLMALLIFASRAPSVNVWLIGLYGLLQIGRFWVLASLGRYWTTRLISLPGAPLVRRGPYRFLRHPNYLIVVAEIAVLPLAFGAWRLALVFSLLNAALLGWRIRIANRMLAERRTPEAPA
jgi:methyltransferase